MSLFEPLFVLLALVAVAMLLTAAAFAISGRFARAGRILRRLGMAATVYFGIVIVVSLIGPRREYRVGEERCFDDWCLTVLTAHRTTQPRAGYDVTLRLSNRARARAMGEKGAVVYAIDSERHRYDPVPDSAAIPFAALLPPGQSVRTHRRFDVPAEAREVGLVYTHEGDFPIGWFVIGEGGWFQRPAVVRLD